MRYFYDTEFLEDGRTIELISIGIVAEDGREYYAVRSDAPWDHIKRHPWLMRNVVPSLPGPRPSTPIGCPQAAPENAKPGDEWFWDLDTSATCVKPKFVIANEVRDFLLAADQPELWADYGAYDHVVLCQMWGPMVDLPDGLPMFTRDIQQEAARLGVAWDELPQQPEGNHNALADARHNRTKLDFLSTRAGV